MTNGEKLRSMTDDEMSDWLSKCNTIPCMMCEHADKEVSSCNADFMCTMDVIAAMYKRWLQSEV